MTSWATWRWVKPGSGVSAWCSGEIQHGQLELADQAEDGVDGVAQPQADVGGDLVVAAAAGVQALASVADQGGEAFSMLVDVLVVEVPGKLAAFDLGRRSAPCRARCRRGRWRR